MCDVNTNYARLTPETFCVFPEDHTVMNVEKGIEMWKSKLGGKYYVYPAELGLGHLITPESRSPYSDAMMEQIVNYSSPERLTKNGSWTWRVFEWVRHDRPYGKYLLIAVKMGAIVFQKSNLTLSSQHEIWNKIVVFFQKLRIQPWSNLVKVSKKVDLLLRSSEYQNRNKTTKISESMERAQLFLFIY